MSGSGLRPRGGGAARGPGPLVRDDPKIPEPASPSPGHGPSKPRPVRRVRAALPPTLDMIRPLPFAAAAVLALSPPLFATGNVLVVDAAAGPGATHTSVQAAVDDASAGDLVLIRAGSYGEVVLNEAIALVADQGALVEIDRVIARPGSTGELLLQGLDLGSPILSALEVTNATAPVRVQDCTMKGGTQVLAVGGGPGVVITGCTAVTFESCTVQGGLLADSSPSPAAVVGGSTVFLFETSIEALDGMDGMPLLTPPDPGGDGLAVSGSTVHLENASILGGDGGDGGPFCQGESAGNAVVLGAGSLLRVLDSSLAGGAGGGSGATCAPGADGLEVAGAGTVLAFPESARRLEVQAVVREGEPFELRYDGAADDLVVLGFATSPAALILPGYATPVLIGLAPPPITLFVGAADAAGAVALPLVLADLGPGLLSVDLSAQAFAFDGAQWHFSNARTVLLLDGTL